MFFPSRCSGSASSLPSVNTWVSAVTCSSTQVTAFTFSGLITRV